jgi:transcriptional regulator GlxA family with amidase domain
VRLSFPQQIQPKFRPSLDLVDPNERVRAGMSAAIDLALALVEKDLGAEIARLVAKILVVHHRRAGGQSQFSTLLDLDVVSSIFWVSQYIDTNVGVARITTPIK